MRIKEQYEKKIVPELIKELGIKNKLALPKLEKVVINIGLGRMGQHASFKDKLLPGIIKDMASISGQKPSLRPAKKSISGFKLREGNIVGAKSTLRGNRMYDLVEKIIKIAFPRRRDFSGLYLKNIDSSGNLNLGFKEHAIFPEIDQDKLNIDFGLQITLVTNTNKRDDSILLYKKLGFLFKEDKKDK